MVQYSYRPKKRYSTPINIVARVCSFRKNGGDCGPTAPGSSRAATAVPGSLHSRFAPLTVSPPACFEELKTVPRTRGCEGISPLGYWQKVTQSPTQTKPYNTLPPFEQRDSCLRMGLYVPTPRFFYNLWGPRESDSSDS